jgi:hypothetical protein
MKKTAPPRSRGSRDDAVPARRSLSEAGRFYFTPPPVAATMCFSVFRAFSSS